MDFGLWRVYFPPILIRTDRRLLVYLGRLFRNAS